MQSQFVTDIINKCYPEDNELRRLLLRHSRDVADRALAIVKKHPELGLDAQFVEDCAMLHDIGIFKTDAPSIHCHGTEPYIRHGICGAAIVRAEGWPDYASVCERHTGAGISRRQVEEQRLPLPPQDYLPLTLTEQVVCYADKFFSKSHPDRVRTVEQAARVCRSLVTKAWGGLCGGPRCLSDGACFSPHWRPLPSACLPLR